MSQEVTKSIGVLYNEKEAEEAKNANPYHRSEERGFNGIHPLPRDRTRKTNIDKLRLTLDVVTGAKFYSSAIKETTGLERKWRKFRRGEEELPMTHQEWDLSTELVDIAEDRDALAVLTKKPIPDEASLKFSAAEHVQETWTSRPP